MKPLERKIRNFFSSNPKSAHDTEAVEANELAFYRRYLRPGMTAFDVGSNVGDVATVFSDCVGATGRVHCFEPGETAFAKLSRLVATLPHKNVTLNHKAVGEVTGKVTFHIYPESHSSWNTRGNRPLKEYGIQLSAEPREEQVDCVTLEDYCAVEKIPKIDLLKVDVEGAELQVFMGCRRMLLEKRVGSCVFEFGQTTFDMGNQPAQLQKFFEEVGYDLRNLIPGDPVFPGGKTARTAQFAMLHAIPRQE